MSLDAILCEVLDHLRWCLTHDRTPDSYPAQFVMWADVVDEIRKAGGGGQVAAVRALLFNEGYIREPSGEYQTTKDGVICIHDASKLIGCVEITGKVLQHRDEQEQPANRDPNRPAQDRQADILAAIDAAGMPLEAVEIATALRIEGLGKLPAQLSWMRKNGVLDNTRGQGYHRPGNRNSA